MHSEIHADDQTGIVAMALGEADSTIPDMGEGEGVGEVSFSGEGFEDVHSGEEGEGFEEVLDAGEEEGEVSDTEWTCSRAEALVGEKRRGGGRTKRGRARARGRGRGRERGSGRGRGRGRGDAHQDRRETSRVVASQAVMLHSADSERG